MYSLPIKRGFKRGLPLSLEVSGPSGPDCVFGDFLHTRKSPRAWGTEPHNPFRRNYPANHSAGLRSPHPRLLSFHEERPHLWFPALSYFSVCGPENGLCPFSKLFVRTLRAYSARARGSFLVEKKGTKDSPKRRYPLWIFLQGDSPLGNFAKRSSFPLSSSAVRGC